MLASTRKFTPQHRSVAEPCTPLLRGETAGNLASAPREGQPLQLQGHDLQQAARNVTRECRWATTANTDGANTIRKKQKGACTHADLQGRHKLGNLPSAQERSAAGLPMHRCCSTRILLLPGINTHSSESQSCTCCMATPSACNDRTYVGHAVLLGAHGASIPIRKHLLGNLGERLSLVSCPQPMQVIALQQGTTRKDTKQRTKEIPSSRCWMKNAFSANLHASRMRGMPYFCRTCLLSRIFCMLTG